jgi:MoaA/NifB/PqqE/SkfB family radical SAM enzyme
MHDISLAHKLKILQSTIVPLYSNKPNLSHVWVTRHCNVKCNHCYVRRFNSPDPSLKEVKKRIDKIKELGCKLTVLFGGEPTLRNDIPDIIRHCKKNDILSYIITNGTLLDKKMADRLGTAGLDVISLLVNTLDNKKSPLVKFGKHSYDIEEKMKLIDYLRSKHDVVAFVAICITKLNMDEIIPLVELAKKYDFGVTLTVVGDPYIIPGVKKGNKSGSHPVFFRTKSDFSKLGSLMKKLEKMKRSGYKIIEPYSYFKMMESFFSKKCCGVCNAGLTFFDINTDGNVMLCPMSEPTGIHHSELSAKNFIEKLKPFRDEQLKVCCDKCVLSESYDPSYYATHILEYANTLKDVC